MSDTLERWPRHDGTEYFRDKGPFTVDGIRYHYYEDRGCTSRWLFEANDDQDLHECDEWCAEDLSYDGRDLSCKKSDLPALDSGRVFRWRPGDPVVDYGRRSS